MAQYLYCRKVQQRRAIEVCKYSKCKWLEKEDCTKRTVEEIKEEKEKKELDNLQ